MELVHYLPKRYPTLFKRQGYDGIENVVMEETHTGLSKKRGTDALRVVARYVPIVICRILCSQAVFPSRLVQDDFLMGREREDGHIYMVGGLICFPGASPIAPLPCYAFFRQVPSLPAFAGFYLLSHTINKPLEVIHTPVPHFNEKMLVSVERTLRRFQPDQPFERSGWMIADDRNMFWRKYLLLLSLSHVSYE